MKHDKHEELRVVCEEPFNAHPPLARLAGKSVTPREDLFVRTHGEVPAVDADELRLEVTGMVKRPLTLRLGDLAVNFPEVEAEITLYGAGNRSAELARISPIAGLLWGAGAVGNAVWRGVPLGEVVEAAGILDGARFVELHGLDEVRHQGRQAFYSGAVPLSVALDPGALLAYEMNGEPLAPEHGFPLRAVIPGYVGARSVKWLHRIEIRGTPSESPFHTTANRLLPPAMAADSIDWTAGFEIGELSLVSLISRPADGAEIEAGAATLEGFALAGGRRTVERVDVSKDNGDSWISAELHPAPVGAWRLWRAELELEDGAHELLCRAWDSAGNSQPGDVAALWNPLGIMNNGWHRIRVWAGTR